jgi:hypothetical protein
MIVKEGVNKSNHPIQNPLLFVTGPWTRDNMLLSVRPSILLDSAGAVAECPPLC